MIQTNVISASPMHASAMNWPEQLRFGARVNFMSVLASMINKITFHGSWRTAGQIDFYQCALCVSIAMTDHRMALYLTAGDGDITGDFQIAAAGGTAGPHHLAHLIRTLRAAVQPRQVSKPQ